MAKKKFKGKVIDYSNRSFLVLCFRKGYRDTMLIEELEDYLLHVNSPYNLTQFLKDVELDKRLDILTEAYRSEFVK